MQSEEGTVSNCPEVIPELTITEKLQGVLEVVPEPLGEGTTESTPVSFSVIVNSGFLRVVTDVTALGTYYVGCSTAGLRLILRRAVQIPT